MAGEVVCNPAVQVSGSIPHPDGTDVWDEECFDSLKGQDPRLRDSEHDNRPALRIDASVFGAPAGLSHRVSVTGTMGDPLDRGSKVEDGGSGHFSLSHEGRQLGTPLASSLLSATLGSTLSFTGIASQGMYQFKADIASSLEQYLPDQGGSDATAVRLQANVAGAAEIFPHVHLFGEAHAQTSVTLVREPRGQVDPSLFHTDFGVQARLHPVQVNLSFGLIGVARLADYRASHSTFGSLSLEAQAHIGHEWSIGAKGSVGVGPDIDRPIWEHQMTSQGAALRSRGLSGALTVRYSPMEEGPAPAERRTVYPSGPTHNGPLMPRDMQERLASFIERSPRLKDGLGKLESGGWNIRWNESGKGSYCAAASVVPELRISIDNVSSDSLRLIGTLGHEMGHAFSQVRADWSSEQARIASGLREEGEASRFMLLVARDLGAEKEIIALKFPDHIDEATQAWNDYLKTGDDEVVRTKLGALFLDATKSTPPYKTYEQGFIDEYTASQGRVSAPR